ncbi:MAG TPA: hypothetical protein VHY09_13425 [Candidatus Methylacidiphilales bacterium]|jgi:hypothetical protein|nr:hypothetical protein [Candidatus Methylacidiphilales bacterium]
MTYESASTLDQEADASEQAPVTITALQKATFYLESRYNLWKRRSIRHYAASAEELAHLEKAAAYCLEKEFEPYIYFQSQVDDLESAEDIANYQVKSFATKSAVERAVLYRKAKFARDKAVEEADRPRAVGSR